MCGRRNGNFIRAYSFSKIVKIRVTQFEEEVRIIYEGDAIWEDGIIQFEDTVINYDESSVVIKRKNELPAYFVFVESENTIHQLDTEFGRIQLNAYTNLINTSATKIFIEYTLENKNLKLSIERILA